MPGRVHQIGQLALGHVLKLADQPTLIAGRRIQVGQHHKGQVDLAGTDRDLRLWDALVVIDSGVVAGNVQHPQARQVDADDTRQHHPSRGRG